MIYHITEAINDELELPYVRYFDNLPKYVIKLVALLDMNTRPST